MYPYDDRMTTNIASLNQYKGVNIGVFSQCCRVRVTHDDWRLLFTLHLKTDKCLYSRFRITSCKCINVKYQAKLTKVELDLIKISPNFPHSLASGCSWICIPCYSFQYIFSLYIVEMSLYQTAAVIMLLLYCLLLWIIWTYILIVT